MKTLQELTAIKEEMRKEMALRLGQGLVAPAFALESLYVEVILCNVPVSANHSVKIKGVAQQVSYDVLAVTVPILLP